MISFTLSPCVALSDFSRLEAKQAHAKSAKRDRFSAFSCLKFQIPRVSASRNRGAHFAFPNQITPFRPASAPRTLALALHQPISSANPKFKIKNPRVSASRPWRPLRAKARVSVSRNCGARPGNAGREQSVSQSPITNLPFRPASAPRTRVGALRPLREQSAFTLVELLAVIGIMGLLAAVGVPALKGLTGSGGRKQALSQLMGALEIARNTAISTGTNAAVIFPDQSFTNQAYRYRSMAVISWDATNSATGTNVMVGSWIVLPQGVVLHDVQINQLPTLRNTTALRIPPKTSPTNISNLRAIVFQSDGGLEESYYTDTLRTNGIAFYEGAVVANFTTTTNTSKQTNNAETITLTRYTGRTIPTLAEPKK